MEKKLQYILKTSYLQILLSVILILVTTIGALFFIDSTQKAQEIISERVKLREFVLARAGASAIGNFFDSREIKLLILASNEDIKAIDKGKSLSLAKTIIEEMKDRPITAIGVLDTEGKIVWSQTATQQKIDEGMDVSDRAYFQWAKNQAGEGNVFVSEPMISRTGATKDSEIIAISTPLFYNKKFNGVLYMIIPVKDLMTKFVTPLTVSPRSVQMLLADDGKVIASTIDESVGTNILKGGDQKGNNIQGLSELAKILLSDQDGSLITELTYPGGKPVKMILGYAPIKVNDLTWYLVVSVPYQEVLDQLNPISTIQNEGLFFLFLCLIVAILFYVITIRISERQGFRSGYSSCLNETKKTT